MKLLGYHSTICNAKMNEWFLVGLQPHPPPVGMDGDAVSQLPTLIPHLVCCCCQYNSIMVTKPRLSHWSGA